LLSEDRLRAQDRLVSFADEHHDEREEGCDAQDSAHNADGDFLGFGHGLVLMLSPHLPDAIRAGILALVKAAR